MSYEKRTLLLGAVLLLGCGDELPGELSGADTTSSATSGGAGGGIGSSSASGSGGEGGRGGAGGQGGEGGSPEPDPTETIIVVGAGGLEPDVPIVVHDEDGAVLSVGQTNAGGALEVNIPPGGAVTALQKGDVFYDGGSYVARFVRTDFDVPPGSTVVFELDPILSYVTPAPMQLTVNLQNYPLAATSASIWACGRRQDPTLYYPAVMNVPFSHFQCADPTFFITVVLRDATGAPIAMKTDGGWSFSPGSTLNRTVASYDPPSTVTTSWAATPANMVDGIVLLNVTAYGLPVLSDSAVLEPGSGGSMVLPVVAAAMQYKHTFLLQYGLPNDRVFYRSASTTSPADITFGAASVDPPNPLGLPNLSEIARPRFSWQGSASDQTGDVTQLHASFADPSSSLTFVARGPALEVGEFRFPALPADLAEYVPSPDIGLYNYYVQRIDYDDIDGYADALGEVADMALSAASAWRNL